MTQGFTHMHLAKKQRLSATRFGMFFQIVPSALLFVSFFVCGYFIYPPLAPVLQPKSFALSDSFLTALSLPRDDIAALLSCALLLCRRELLFLCTVFAVTFSFFGRTLSYTASSLYAVSLGMALARLHLFSGPPLSPVAFYAFLVTKAISSALLLLYMMRATTLSRMLGAGLSRDSIGLLLKECLLHLFYGIRSAAAVFILSFLLSFLIR